MAEINKLVAQHFRFDLMSNFNCEAIAFELNAGLGNVGRLVISLRDQIVHGKPGCGSGVCDVDEVAAGLDGLLMLLGNLGHMVDLLDQALPADGECGQ